MLALKKESRGQVSEQVKGFLERWNRTLVYAQQGIFNAEDVPPGESVDFLEKDILGEPNIHPE